MTQQESTQDPFESPLDRIWDAIQARKPGHDEARLYITSSGGWCGPSEAYAALLKPVTQHE